MVMTPEEVAAFRKRGGGENIAPQAAPAPAPTEPAVSGTTDSVTETTPADPVAADPATANGDAPVPEAPKAGKNSASARIQELVEERNALRAYGKHLETRLAEGAAKPAQPLAPQISEHPPQLKDFGFDTDKHAAAMATWTKSQVDTQVSHAVQRVTEQQRIESTRQAFESRVEAFRAATPDFDDVISNPALPSLHERAASMVVVSEKGPQMAYHLAKNPDVAVRISRMHPDQQIMALGRIEAQLNASSSPQQKSAVPAASRAPAPPTPVPSGSSPGKDPNSPSASMQDFVSAHRARVSEARRRKTR